MGTMAKVKVNVKYDSHIGEYDNAYIIIDNVAISWLPNEQCWLLDIGAGMNQKLLNGNEALFDFIAQVTARMQTLNSSY